MNNTELFASVFTEDNHNLTCSVSCFGGYVTSPPLQLVCAGI